MFSVAILMTIYNRRERVLASLEEIIRQSEALASGGEYSFDIYVHDDGSTDGAGDAVEKAFPSVILLRGDGNRFWSRGLRAAWMEAAKKGYDFYMWTDYDSVLREDAMWNLLDTSSFLANKAIVCGTVANPDGVLMYGGRSRSGKIIEPDGYVPVPCYLFDGHLVLVPKYVFRKVGLLDERFHQGLGDYDYAYRSGKARIDRVVAAGILADCSRKVTLPSYRDASLTLRERYEALSKPKGKPLKENFLFDVKSKGLFKAIWNFLKTNFQVLFPKHNG
jgi:GT2 family glycosyltransferase